MISALTSALHVHKGVTFRLGITVLYLEIYDGMLVINVQGLQCWDAITLNVYLKHSDQGIHICY